MVLFTLKKPRRSIVSGPTQYIDPNRGHYGTVSPTKPKPSRLKKWLKKFIQKFNTNPVSKD